jgi:hypothetical protein
VVLLHLLRDCSKAWFGTQEKNALSGFYLEVCGKADLHRQHLLATGKPTSQGQFLIRNFLRESHLRLMPMNPIVRACQFGMNFS